MVSFSFILPKTNITPKNRPSQKSETNIPTINFRCKIAVSFREGILHLLENHVMPISAVNRGLLPTRTAKPTCHANRGTVTVGRHISRCLGFRRASCHPEIKICPSCHRHEWNLTSKLHCSYCMLILPMRSDRFSPSLLKEVNWTISLCRAYNTSW